MVDYEKLEFLRRNTILNPIDYIKIHRLRLIANIVLNQNIEREKEVKYEGNIRQRIK